MLSRFDRRVVAESVLAFVRRCQERFACNLGGGAALSGAYLAHRTTGDIDLYLDDADDMRAMVAALSDTASAVEGKVTILRDAGHLVRARLDTPQAGVEMDIVHDPVPDIEKSAPALEGIVVKALADLRANKLTCILSRSEPRDLVDLYFLDRTGHPPEQDLDLAHRKDAGIDPGILAWLLSQFPTAPLPGMLEPLTSEELETFRRELAERMRRIAVS